MHEDHGAEVDQEQIIQNMPTLEIQQHREQWLRASEQAERQMAVAGEILHC